MMRRVAGSVLVVAPLTAVGLLAVWSGLFLRGESHFSRALLEDVESFWFVARWVLHLPDWAGCSLLWLVGGGCLLLGLGLLGEFWGTGGHTLLGAWAVTHLGVFGLAAVVASIIHPQPGAFWRETGSVVASPMAGLSVGWTAYFVGFFGLLLGSCYLVMVRKRPVQKGMGMNL